MFLLELEMRSGSPLYIELGSSPNFKAYTQAQSFRRMFLICEQKLKPGAMAARNLFLLLLPLLLSMISVPSHGAIVNLDWEIRYAYYTRLCHTKPLVTVNGQFPGPIVNVQEGDTVNIKVTNLVQYNITIHWHGIRQLRSAWADGPAFITQCPIQTNASYVYSFQVIDQRGTLFWHAHFSWLRATVYGAFIICPKVYAGYWPTQSIRDISLVIGEWWNANPEDVIAQALVSGGAYQVSNALTINGQPGALYDCSQAGMQIYNVKKGETLLLRLINAAVNFDVYFTAMNHTLTVVEADAEYVKPFQTNVVFVAAGQTTNVLLTANQPIGRYYMAVSVYSPVAISFPQTPATAILSYEGADVSSKIPLPVFPASDDTAYERAFTDSLRSLSEYTLDVPKSIDRHLLFTVGYALQSCPFLGRKCSQFGGRLSASISNVTFLPPGISILQAYYNHISGVYETDFPDIPLFQYNYTGVDPANRASVVATKVNVLEYNSAVQLILQDTATLGIESHPIHLHGQNFYVVGTGSGNFDPKVDTANFNLIDPPSRNTIAVPYGGWAALRFRANNPGVWYMHCHFDIHVEWGMSMVFLTKEGPLPSQKLLPPPIDLPKC